MTSKAFRAELEAKTGHDLPWFGNAVAGFRGGVTDVYAHLRDFEDMRAAAGAARRTANDLSEIAALLEKAGSDDNVVVKVSTSRDDLFRKIDRQRLKEIASRLKPGEDYDIPTLDRMRTDFWEGSMEYRAYSSSEADYELVLDGSLDRESWEELLEGEGGTP